ncbi:DUF3618 domain-containing protein [Nocardioides humi]|uniref:DUF3618 domain-containing protein n=1 Tax=Nocardioides humi TaxID=449461 RepID=A0ABN2B1K3_9ACTN|nr:DUF3618 domain-containing protein [Nocardioides humi]
MNDATGRPDLAALETEIERTRSDLARDIDLLAAKADVVGRTRARLRGAGASPGAIAGGVLAVAAAVATVVVLRRRRGGRR